MESAHNANGCMGVGMGRRTLVAAGVIVALMAATATAIVVMQRGQAANTSSDIPNSAQAAVKLLVSAHGRQALTPELNRLLRKGRLFPSGTTFTARPGSWHQAGAYANVTGVLREPGKPPT